MEGMEEALRVLNAARNFDPEPALERAAYRMMNVVRDQEDFPYETGDLQRSGRVERATLYWDDLEYAAPVEDRTLFFGPLVEEEGPKVVWEELETAIDEALNG